MQIVDWEALVKLMGTDCTIYVLFIKQAAVMFFFLFITQTCLLLPLYYSGDGYKAFTIDQANNSTEQCVFNATAPAGVDKCPREGIKTLNSTQS